MKPKTQIDVLRKKIEKLDENLLETINRRFLYGQKIALLKRKEKLSIEQPDREKELLQINIHKGKKMELPSGFIKKIFQLIFSQSKKEQSLAQKGRKA